MIRIFHRPVKRGRTPNSQLWVVVTQLTAIQTQGIPQEESELYKQIAEKYIELGGAFHLDYVHTVFGQVTEGMEVVDAIAAAETGTNDKPLEDVTIISIEIVNKEEK